MPQTITERTELNVTHENKFYLLYIFAIILKPNLIQEFFKQLIKNFIYT